MYGVYKIWHLMKSLKKKFLFKKNIFVKTIRQYAGDGSKKYVEGWKPVSIISCKCSRKADLSGECKHCIASFIYLLR